MAGARVDLTWGPIEFHQKSLDSLNVSLLPAMAACANYSCPFDTAALAVAFQR